MKKYLNRITPLSVALFAAIFTVFVIIGNVILHNQGKLLTHSEGLNIFLWTIVPAIVSGFLYILSEILEHKAIFYKFSYDRLPETMTAEMIFAASTLVFWFYVIIFYLESFIPPVAVFGIIGTIVLNVVLIIIGYVQGEKLGNKSKVRRYGYSQYDF